MHRTLCIMYIHVEVAWEPNDTPPEHRIGLIVATKSNQTVGSEMVAVGGARELSEQHGALADSILRISSAVGDACKAQEKELRAAGMTPPPLLHQCFGLVKATKIKSKFQTRL